MLTDSETAIAREVLIRGPISRSALSARLGLSPASLTRLAKPFLERGILVEVEDSRENPIGRPTRPLDIAPDLGIFVGVKITEECLYVVATDVRANLVSRSETALTDTSPEAVVTDIVASVRDISPERPRGVGIGLGGVVDGDRVEFAPFLSWSDVPLGEMLTAALGVPVVLENDLVALAEAERWFGLGTGVPGFSVITIGVGVGYGLVVDGRVVHSREAGAGLGGHLPLSAIGPVCPEGHRGCARAMLTSGSIAAQVSAALQRPVDYDEVMALAAKGNAAARAVTGAAADALGRFIGLAANLTLQPAVVLAGDGIDLYVLETERVAAAVADSRDPRADPIQIFVDDSGFTAWARGAAAVAIQQAVDTLTLHAD